MPASSVVTGEPCPEGQTLQTTGGTGDNPCSTCYKCEADDDGGCISGHGIGEGSYGDPSGPCVDSTTATTTAAKVAGLYQCTGGVDDKGEMTWPGGSFSSPASMPDVGPCYGAHDFSFTASLGVGDTVSCNAGSWGGGIECHLSCCLVTAP